MRWMPWTRPTIATAIDLTTHDGDAGGGSARTTLDVSFYEVPSRLLLDGCSAVALWTYSFFPIFSKLAGWNGFELILDKSCHDLKTDIGARLSLPWGCFLLLLLPPTSPSPALEGNLLSLQREDSAPRRRSPTTFGPPQVSTCLFLSIFLSFLFLPAGVWPLVPDLVAYILLLYGPGCFGVT